MRKIISILFLLPCICQSQVTDSLNILRHNDWQTLQWFSSDTVYMRSKIKVEDYAEKLDSLQFIKLKKMEHYGERIHFDDKGQLEYSYTTSCPVGESLKTVHSIELVNNKLIVDFEYTKWPWEHNRTTRRVRTFEIITWNSKRIVLK